MALTTFAGLGVGEPSMATDIDDRGQALFEVAVGAVIIILVLTAIAGMLSGLGTSSNSQRDIVIAQNLATQELATLRSQAASSGGFPPSDASGTPAALASNSIPALATDTYTSNGTTFYTYAVGGYCTLTTSSGVGSWVAYTSTTNAPTPTNPANYIVGVIITWEKTVNAPSSAPALTISSTDRVDSSRSHLLLTGGIAIPSGDQAPTPSTTASVCPAVLQ